MYTNLYKKLKYHFILLGFLSLLVSCRNQPYRIDTVKSGQTKIDSNLTSDPSITKFVEPYKDKLEKEVNVVLSYTSKTLTREDGELQSSLGNIYADICFQKANPKFKKIINKEIDMAMFNYGGVRQAINKGEIKVKDVFKLMPFENMLVVVELDGKQIKELFKYFEKEQKAHPLSGVNLGFNGEKLKKITIHDKPFDETKNYYVLTSDYLQHGGDHMDFFKNPVNLYSLNYKVRDALLDYMKEKDTVRIELDNRVIIDNNP
ncbi:MAG: 5'-nucleotidase [Bacteroidota bacterium]